MNAITSLVETPSAGAIQQALDAQQTTVTKALLFHTRDNGSRLSLVTAHEIHHDRKQRMSFRKCRPLSPQDEMDILHLLRPAAQSDCFTIFPPSLLQSSGNYTMWWLPPQSYPMALLEQDSAKPVLRHVMWPNLVLMATQRRLYVVAISGKDRPTEDSACYFAPLANVWSNTEVCTGSALLPETQDIASIQGWNSVLRDSAFSHANAQNIIRNPSKKTTNKSIDPMDYWKKSGGNPFPDASLVPLKFKLRDWIDFTNAVERR